MLRRRFKIVDVEETDVFDSPDIFTHLCRMSGGHVRNLLIYFRSASDYVDSLPFTEEAVKPRHLFPPKHQNDLGGGQNPLRCEERSEPSETSGGALMIPQRLPRKWSVATSRATGTPDCFASLATFGLRQSRQFK